MSHPKSPPEAASLFNVHGQRKYLCQAELSRFQNAAESALRPIRLFALVLEYTGCRISEALETTPRRIDKGIKCLIFRTLKRRRTIYRAVPIPTWLLNELLDFARTIQPDARLWPWCRPTAWRHICALMHRASIAKPMGCPRGLRHGFGIRAIDRGVSLNVVQRLMGHASPRSTAIYLEAVGAEERKMVARMW